MSSCGLLLVFIYSSAAVFMIVDGQSATDDAVDMNIDLCTVLSVVEQQARTIATLQAELAKWVANVKKLEARQLTADNRVSV